MGYISLLIVALLIAVLTFIGFRPRVQLPKEQGVNAIGYQDLLSNVKSQVGEASKAGFDRAKETEDLK